MASYSNLALQVSPLPKLKLSFQFYCYSCSYDLPVLQSRYLNINISRHQELNRKKHKNLVLGSNLQYEIARKTRWSPGCTNKTPTTNLSFKLYYATHVFSQEYDQDMTESSSPPSHKRFPLPSNNPSNTKKTKSDLQSEHARYANQDIWLGSQTMELLAKDAKIPPQETPLSIREMIKRGYEENEAA